MVGRTRRARVLQLLQRQHVANPDLVHGFHGVTHSAINAKTRRKKPAADTLHRTCDSPIGVTLPQMPNPQRFAPLLLRYG